MSLVLFAAATAALAAGAVGAWVGRKLRGPSEPVKLPPAQSAPEDSLRDCTLALGDVVSVLVDAPGTSLGGAASRERWLTGALVLREGSDVVAVLFFAPEGARLESVAAFAAPRREIAWLSSADSEIGPEPPSTLEIAGKVLLRSRRLPVRFERLGRNVPRLGEEGTFAEYASGRDVAIVVRSGAGSIALAGVRLDDGEFERMGSGGLS